MFSLFRSQREGKLEVVPHETDFFHRYERLLPPRKQFESNLAEHANVDLRLVEAIESLLVPTLGAWEQSDRWFHQMDHYGDGVRSLILRRDLFPREAIPELQALLVGEHAKFTILCCVVDRLVEDAASKAAKRPDDYLAIWAQSFLATRSLASALSSDA